MLILLGLLPLSSHPGPPYLAVLTTARLLHSWLWGKHINSVLDQVSDCPELYLSQTKVRDLQLSNLGYTEEALLVREEYITAVNLLEGPFRGFQGVVITGQPGIGMFTIVLLLSSSGNDQFRQIMLFVLCSLPLPV